MTLRRIVQLPAEQAGAALRPKFVQGKWKRPMLSGRKAMQLKQKAKENDLLGNWIVGQGGWLPQWDKPNKHRVMRPPKGTKHERNELQRVTKIQTALAQMPKKLEEHRKAMQALKPLRGLDRWLQETEEDEE